MQNVEEEEEGAGSLGGDVGVVVADDCTWVLPDPTHKQDDRAFVRLVDGSPDDGLPQIWRYYVVRPEGEDGQDYETVVDADEAFNIVHRKNKILRKEQQYGKAQRTAAD
jgi:hypothetical protein